MDLTALDFSVSQLTAFRLEKLTTRKDMSLLAW